MIKRSFSSCVFCLVIELVFRLLRLDPCEFFSSLALPKADAIDLACIIFSEDLIIKNEIISFFFIL